MDNRNVRGRALGDGVGAGPEFAAEVLVGALDELHDAVELLRPGEDIDLREALLKVIGFEADHAAHERDLESGLLALEFADAAELGVGAVLGVLAHAAGVEHDDVGSLDAVGRFEADAVEARCELFAICLVHLAADGPEVVLAW